MLVIIGRIAFGLALLILFVGVIWFAIDTIKEIREERKD